MMKHRLILVTGILFLGAIFAGQAFAQTAAYPTRVIDLVSANAAGEGLTLPCNSSSPGLTRSWDIQ